MNNNTNNNNGKKSKLIIIYKYILFSNFVVLNELNEF